MATQSFRRIIELLEQHGVEYVVVGGVAAVLQGAPVTTFDFDALFKVEAGNIERLVAVLAELDARYRERPDLRPTPRDLAAGQRILLLTNCGPFDKKSLSRHKDQAAIRLLEALVNRKRDR